MKKTVYAILIAIAGIAIIFNTQSCKKADFDTPPLDSVNTNKVITIAQLKEMMPATGEPLLITDTLSLYATITGDESSGNLYKELYIQDTTAGIRVVMAAASNFKQGQLIRLNLKGLTLAKNYQMIEIGTADKDYHIVPQNVYQEWVPDTVNFVSNLKNDKWLGKLIYLNNVQFIVGDTAFTYADKPLLVDKSRYIKDINGDSIIVRNSAYSDFADYKIPNGSGTMVAIMSKYNNDYQLKIRKIEEVKFDATQRLNPITSILAQDFTSFTTNVDINASGWVGTKIYGTKNWYCGTYSTYKYAQISAYNSGDTLNVAWMISPAVNLDATHSEYFGFETKAGFQSPDHTGLSVYYSKDYDGNVANIGTATWIKMDVAVPVGPTGGYNSTWLPSGMIDFSKISGTVYIGFKYEGAGTKAKTTTYEVDNIFVKGYNN